MALVLALEPIFEADFCPTSYGFRPGRRAQDAIEEVRHLINPPACYEWVIEGDVENCFGSIHHGLLLAELRRRVTDKRVLGLLRQFLGAGIMTQQGSLAATPSGTPQGAILSPLLANVALSVLDRHFQAAWAARTKNQRVRDRAKGLPSYRMIRYADDFVVLVRGSKAHAQALKEQTAELMREHLRLTLSPEKTQITHVDDGFDLLGFRIVRRPRPGHAPVAYSFPSKRALREVMHRIKELTGRTTTNLSLEALIHALNPVLRGWTNYHRHGASKRCFAYLSHYLWWRVVRWLRKKYPRLTWKQIKRRYWQRTWNGVNGARLAWPAEVAITRYRYRGYRIPSARSDPRTNPNHQNGRGRWCLTSHPRTDGAVLRRAGCRGIGTPGSAGEPGKRAGAPARPNRSIRSGCAACTCSSSFRSAAAESSTSPAPATRIPLGCCSRRATC
jgi:RNA-directed DNA polymerase